jgi:hypothetical protein
MTEVNFPPLRNRLLLKCKAGGGQRLSDFQSTEKDLQAPLNPFQETENPRERMEGSACSGIHRTAGSKNFFLKKRHYWKGCLLMV